ncbi:MAG TPA: hypothetical protein VN083_06385 [Vicinamibacteria bacterium]|jgi:hypothetical protein|nr:hypothetical protein [Vicinamibacteria bacterium]
MTQPAPNMASFQPLLRYLRLLHSTPDWSRLPQLEREALFRGACLQGDPALQEKGLPECVSWTQVLDYCERLLRIEPKGFQGPG